MDIGSPPREYDPLHSASPTDEPYNPLQLPSFSSSYPLPFRVLTLVGLAIFLWAVNLHVLGALGIDTSWALDLRVRDGNEVDEEDAQSLLLVDGAPNADEAVGGTVVSRGTANQTLDIPLNNLASPIGPLRTRRQAKKPPVRPSPHSLARPVYMIFAVYSLWVAAGWSLFNWVTDGDPETMESWRGLILIVVFGVVLGVSAPWRSIGRRERVKLLQSFKRILIPNPNRPPHFSDVILADILTSFAKVLGDLWVSSAQIWGGGVSKGRVRLDGWSNWVVLGMVSLPYILRFRQCVLEYLLPTNTSTRPLLNALKYASAFPVIFLSAAQKTVVKEIALSTGMSVEELAQTRGRWFGEHRMFRIWLLAVIVNSMYSFWWDVSYDWGLSLLQPSTWSKPSNSSTTTPPIPSSTSLASSANWGNPSSGSRLGVPGSRSPPRPSSFITKAIRKVLTPLSPTTDAEVSPHQRSPCPSPGPEPRFNPRGLFLETPEQDDPGITINSNGTPTLLPRGEPLTAAKPFLSLGDIPNPLLFGLRPTLLYPDPIVYHLFIFLDFILRFTWSLKLSSHLYTISEIESGVFMMEALELVRRAMWVFLRVEWEVVKKMDEREKRRLEEVMREEDGLDDTGDEKVAML